MFIKQLVSGRLFRCCFVLIMVVSMLPFGVKPSSAAQADVPRFEPAPCDPELMIGAVEGQDIICGFVVVPETYDNPDGPTIRLAVAIIKSREENPEPDPLVMMQGGPGGSTLEYFTLQLLTTGRLRTNRDIILFDQRGTLHSEPELTCPEYMELQIETLDDDISDEEFEALFQQAMSDCRERLVSEGVNLSAFDSIENAHDVDAVRQALGYDQINLYGVSYGTLLALHTMRLHPEGLRSVILDSVVPPQINFITRAPQTQAHSFQMVFQNCAADAECARAYPNLEQVFYELVDKLNADPVIIDITDPETQNQYEALLDGDSLMGAIFQMLYITDAIPLIPGVIYDARAGDFTFLSQILGLIVFDRTMSMGMYYTVMCAEDADFNPEDVDLEGLPPQVAAMNETSGTSFLDTCKIWNVEPLGSDVDEPVSSDIPTLVLNGAYDPITPPEYGEEAAKTLSNSYVFTFPTGGHGAAFSGECQDQIILEFLDNPNSPPDGSCITDQSGVQFATPGAIIDLPSVYRLLNFQGTSLIELILFMLALLFLLTAVLVYPVVWLVRLFTRSSQPQPAQPLPAEQGEPVFGGYPSPAPAPQAPPPPRPLTWRLAPWLPVLLGGMLAVFMAILITILFGMVMNNDLRILIGMPGSARPLFILPILAVLFTLAMLVIVITAWAKGWGSVWGKLYYTLLTLAAVTCLVVLGVWGMLTALVA